MKQANAGAAHNTLQRGWAALAVTLTVPLMLAVSACSGEQETDQVEPYPVPDPLFYELANADGEVEGWLFGTIHALPEGVSWRTPAIEKAVDEADLLMVEVADLRASGQIGQIFAELASTPGLPSITQRVSQAQRPKLERMLANSDLAPSSFIDVEDWASAIMLARVDAPGDPRNGVDRAIIAEFPEGDVRGFETARSQLGIFDQLAPDDQRALLEGTIEEWAESRSDPGKLVNAWIAGDVATLEQATSTGIMSDPELREALLVKRNTEWMKQLLPVLTTPRRPLVAVGAAHLVGDEGLPHMLESEGYTVRRISSLRVP